MNGPLNSGIFTTWTIFRYYLQCHHLVYFEHLRSLWVLPMSLLSTLQPGHQVKFNFWCLIFLVCIVFFYISDRLNAQWDVLKSQTIYFEHLRSLWLLPMSLLSTLQPDHQVKFNFWCLIFLVCIVFFYISDQLNAQWDVLKSQTIACLFFNKKIFNVKRHLPCRWPRCLE